MCGEALRLYDPYEPYDANDMIGDAILLLVIVGLGAMVFCR
jgi:hypothetical protein